MINQDCGTQLVGEFKKNQKVLTAIGDETRQAIIVTLMQGTQTPGMRVGEITERTNLSRPAVSHHLRILKEAEIISVRKKGTMNYYHLDSGSTLKQLKPLFVQLESLLLQCE
jgi:DNA-binding transcriptional ArsR family regulator